MLTATCNRIYCRAMALLSPNRDSLARSFGGLCLIVGLLVACGESEAPEATCTPETLNCECGPNAACGTTPDGIPMVCADGGVCKTNGCTAGELYCLCGDNSTCATGGECRDGMCLSPTSVTLSVPDGNARACDVLLSVSTRGLERVTFTDSAMGSRYVRGSKVGLAFTRRIDAPFSGVAAVIDLKGKESPAASDVSVDVVRCYNQLGAEITTADVTLK